MAATACTPDEHDRGADEREATSPGGDSQRTLNRARARLQQTANEVEREATASTRSLELHSRAADDWA